VLYRIRKLYIAIDFSRRISRILRTVNRSWVMLAPYFLETSIPHFGINLRIFTISNLCGMQRFGVHPVPDYAGAHQNTLF
jgi:hypothetical protein